MAELTILHTSDGLRAFLLVAPEMQSRYPSAQELVDALKRRGVVFGVDLQAIEKMVAQHTCSTRVEVARGTPAKAGVAGNVEMLIDVSEAGKPRELKDGRVDHRDLQIVVNVKKGQPLARHTPPQPGTEGKTVFGKPIVPEPVGDQPLLSGVGTVRSSEDPELLVAAMDGALIVGEESLIEVRNKKLIKGDIDYSTGNVVFSGDLVIGGSVRAGFSVEATGSISIGGRVEDAKVKSGGDMTVAGGAVGSGNASLQCGGSLKVRHVENFDVTAEGSVSVSEDAVHSTIVSGTEAHAKSIVGGTIAAMDRVEAESIGSASETRTVIDIGRRYVLAQQRVELMRKIAHLAGEAVALKGEMYALVRDKMDDKGVLAEADEKELASLKTRRVECYEMCKTLQAQIESMEELVRKESVPVLSARQVFPNTLVKFGTGERLIMEVMHDVTIVPSDEKQPGAVA